MNTVSDFEFDLQSAIKSGPGLKTSSGLFPDSIWLEADTEGDGLEFQFEPGKLQDFNFIHADFLLDGLEGTHFSLILQEGEIGPAFALSFGLLNQCQARMVVPLEAVNQNRWMYPRQGAYLKPLCWLERVDLRRVDRLKVVINRKGPTPVRWCMTNIRVTTAAPSALEHPLLPMGPLVDAFGQNRLRSWAGKSQSAAEVTDRLRQQLSDAPQAAWPTHYSKWGGWLNHRLPGSGYFRTHHDGSRWWLVDPDGYLFWSSGMDCVHVDTAADIAGLENALTWLPEKDGEYADIFEGPTMNFLAANHIRAFGPTAWRKSWAEIAYAQLRQFGVNSVGNWSDWQVASQQAFPYVRPLNGEELQGVPRIFRDFPDVYHPNFPAAAAQFAEQLRPSADDPALIGYFLMNEPNWGFAGDSPAAGMLYTTPACDARRELAAWLQSKYGIHAGLAQAWEMEASLEAVTSGIWSTPLTPQARTDLDAFSSQMVRRFFEELSAACKAVDSHHLNLGVRYYTVPPQWAEEGMRSFDVFSMNCYKPRIPAVEVDQIAERLRMPVIIGEWHFGALDAGLPASGIGHVRTQADRGSAYRVYLEDAAANPNCVGVHYFILYDQSTLGRYDGENYNIGFVDVCGRPYPELAQAARASHEHLYPVAAHQEKPFDQPPEYLPMLFY